MGFPSNFWGTPQTQGKRQGGVPSSLTPVVIVPSLIGSKLQAQLNGYRSQYVLCTWTTRHDTHDARVRTTLMDTT